MTTKTPPSHKLIDRAFRMVVLGVDPGTIVTGYGLVEQLGPHTRLLVCGAIKSDAGLPLPQRLSRISRELRSLIRKQRPDAFAIESSFYGRNAQSALKLGYARGVSLLAAVENNIPIAEYSPREIKKAVTGNGHASKDQVQFMIRRLVDVADTPMATDTSDAIATALCHLHRLKGLRKPAKDWKAFVTAHPERIIS